MVEYKGMFFWGGVPILVISTETYTGIPPSLPLLLIDKMKGERSD